ncbi:MAG: amidase [Burkholderiaceae bacterium]
MSDVSSLSAAQMSAMFRQGELSPVTAVEAVLSRMDACEPTLNAMYLIKAEQALAAARLSEQRWSRNQPLGPLDGVPVTIKENIDTAGDPTPAGTAATDLTPRQADAPQAARLAEAGCVLVGKTVMPDFGMLSAGLSSIHGRTHNPWNLERNTSGSSSGAGAAAAAGYGPLHLGTDIGGSVRLPATHCGLFGHKPSLGRIPVNPPFMGRATGPMTRTVLDSAMLLEVLSRPDNRDWMSLPYQPEQYAEKLDQQSVKGLKIGVLTDMNCGLPVAPEVREATEAAATALEQAGAIVQPVDSFLTVEMLDGICRFFEARSYNDIVAMDDLTREKVLPFIIRWCTYRAGGFSGADVMAAYMQVNAMREAAVSTTARFDFMISPVSPILPFGVNEHAPGDNPENALPHIAFTVPYNMSEQPAASVNWTHTSDGLPVGVQVIGQRFDDLGVLQLSRQLEQLRGEQQAWPRVVPG